MRLIIEKPSVGIQSRLKNSTSIPTKNKSIVSITTTKTMVDTVFGHAESDPNQKSTTSWNQPGEDTINEWISPQQQGFLRSRSILQNLMDIDLASMLTALGKNRGCTILFDFSSAFPSISQKYLIELFSELGIPESAINFVKALYHENFCDIAFKGDRYPGSP